MRTRAFALTLLVAPTLLSGLSGCNSTGADESETPATADRAVGPLDVEYQELLSSGATQVTDAGQLVIDNAEDFVALWAKCSLLRLPSLEVPEIDWKTQRVLCVAAGNQPTAGYAISIEEIQRVERDGEPDVTTVYYSEHAPSDGSTNAEVVTCPVHVVAIPRTDGRIEFTRR